MIPTIITGDFTMEDTGTQAGTGTLTIDHMYSVIESTTEDRLQKEQYQEEEQ